LFRVPSRINSTWGGSLVDMVRATKILEIIEEDQLLAQVGKTGKHLQSRLHDRARSYPAISNVRGTGLLCAFDLPDAAQRNAFLKNGLAEGALFLGCGDRSIRFRPALMIEPAAIDEGMDIIHRLMGGLN